MRVPPSPNLSPSQSMPLEVAALTEESALVEDCNAENLYLMGLYSIDRILYVTNLLQRQAKNIVLFSLSLGMELFEEALQKWELALNIRHRSRSRNDSTSSNSLALQGAATALPVMTQLMSIYRMPKSFATKHIITCTSCLSW